MMDNSNTLNIELSDAQHRTAMEASSKLMIRVLRGQVKSPANLMWREVKSPRWRVDDSHNSLYQARIAAWHEERNERADRLRIEPREPCPKCGIRADIGCKHTITAWQYLTESDPINRAWDFEIAAARHREEAA